MNWITMWEKLVSQLQRYTLIQLRYHFVRVMFAALQALAESLERESNSRESSFYFNKKIVKTCSMEIYWGYLLSECGLNGK